MTSLIREFEMTCTNGDIKRTSAQLWKINRCTIVKPNWWTPLQIDRDTGICFPWCHWVLHHSVYNKIRKTTNMLCRILLKAFWSFRDLSTFDIGSYLGCSLHVGYPGVQFVELRNFGSWCSACRGEEPRDVRARRADADEGARGHRFTGLAW